MGCSVEVAGRTKAVAPRCAPRSGRAGALRAILEAGMHERGEGLLIVYGAAWVKEGESEAEATPPPKGEGAASAHPSSWHF